MLDDGVGASDAGVSFGIDERNLACDEKKVLTLNECLLCLGCRAAATQVMVR